MSTRTLSRRGFLGLSVAAFAGAMLGACKPVAPAGGKKETPAGQAAVPAGNYQACTLKFWIWDDVQRQTEQARCDLTTKKHPQVKAVIEVFPWGEYWSKLHTNFAAGTPPDIHWNHGDEFPVLVSKGAFLDLQPYIDANTDNQKIIAGVFKANLQNYLFKCELHGVPRNAACQAIAYNLDCFEKAGLEPVKDDWTWDDLLQYAKALTKEEEGRVTQWGFFDGASLDPHVWCPFVYSNDGRVFDMRNTWKCVIDSPQTVQAFQFLADLALVHKVSPLPDVMSEIDNTAFFQTGKVAMMVLGSWSMKSYNELSGLRYNVARIPYSPHTKKSVNETTGLAACVAAKTKFPAEAAAVAIGLASVEAQGGEIYSEEIPCRPEAAATWSDPKLHPPANRGIYLEMLKTGIPRPVHPSLGATEWQKIINDQLTLIFTGRKPVADGVKEMQAGISKLVDESGALPEGFQLCPSYPGV